MIINYSPKTIVTELALFVLGLYLIDISSMQLLNVFGVSLYGVACYTLGISGTLLMLHEKRQKVLLEIPK